MDSAKTLTFYLDDAMRKRAQDGKTNIINRISAAFQSKSYQCLFKENSAVNLLQSARDPGFSMFHMEDPFHPRSLNLRRAYYYPFWRIEASAKRWEWQVAKATFDPDLIDATEADRFVDYWRNQMFGNTTPQAKSNGYIYAPLQGCLLERRSFQAASPIEMLETTLQLDPDRLIKSTLHPRESYSEQEMTALSRLADKNPRLQLSATESSALIEGCAYVVTQNSALVLDGFFQQKPAILFGKIDFHHIAQNVDSQGAKAAFANVLGPPPEYSKFLYWFLQVQSINAGRDDAEAKILETVQSHGWDI